MTAQIGRHTVNNADDKGLQQRYHDHTGSQKTTDTSNQRTGSKLVHELYHRARLSSERSVKLQGSNAVRDDLSRKASVSQVLEDDESIRDRNPTRSTRASSQFKKHTKDLFDEHEDAPKVERYSRTHGLGVPWKKPLTYPLVGKKKTTVEFSDLERLDEGELLNDSLISFQLRFLEHNLEERRPELAKRVYFFNTFFFATLMNTHKGRKGFNYGGVQKWTRNVDLFTYDYIVVPINDSLHWYLAIICNLPALDRGLDLSEEEPGSPAGRTAKSLPSSSPTTALPEGDAVTLIEEAKEPDERGARNSFAELSLNVNAMQRRTGNATEDLGAKGSNSTEEDREMLDGQPQGSMPGATRLRNADENPEERQKTPDQPLGRPAKAAASPGKRKRKSMPPVTKLDPTNPAIITFDSLGLNRSSTVRILKDYLREEAKAKRGGMDIETGQIKGITASVIPLQENWYDCGLFLLGYVDKLFEDDPKEFITKVIRRKYDVQEDWPKLQPNLARKHLREQLMKLHDEQEAERQKERVAGKSGRVHVKQDSKVKSSPSREISPAKAVHRDVRDEREEVHKAAEDPEELSSPNQPTTRDEALKTALSLPPYNFEADITNLMQNDASNKTYEACLHSGEKGNEEQQPKARSSDLSAAKEDESRSGMPGSFVDEPSVVDVESQSKSEELPRSFQHSHGEHSAPAYAEEPPELPAEIQDSQPSETSRLIAEIHRSASDEVVRQPIKKRDVQEFPYVLIESPKEPKRRKTGHETVISPTQKVPKKQDSQSPHRSKRGRPRRMADRKAQGADEIINIDD